MVLTTAMPATATMVKRMSLARVAAEAAQIVHATVAEVHSGRDASGFPATWITFDVARTLKGGRTSRLTIKQFGVAAALPDGTITRLAGLPQYRVGEEVVVFLHANSALGFTSPVGLGQGCYRVRRSSAQALARSELPAAAPEPLDAFLSKIERLAGTAQ
jgi:hypothetical protein